MDAPKPISDPYGHNLVHTHAQQLVVAPFPRVIENALVQKYKLAATLDGNVAPS